MHGKTRPNQAVKIVFRHFTPPQVATAVGVTRQAAHRWSVLGRIPAEHCIAVETLLTTRVSRLHALKQALEAPITGDLLPRAIELLKPSALAREMRCGRLYPRKWAWQGVPPQFTKSALKLTRIAISELQSVDRFRLRPDVFGSQADFETPKTELTHAEHQ